MAWPVHGSYTGWCVVYTDFLHQSVDSEQRYSCTAVLQSGGLSSVSVNVLSECPICMHLYGRCRLHQLPLSGMAGKQAVHGAVIQQ